jgi:Na+/melibiose symporter-like transporter
MTKGQKFRRVLLSRWGFFTVASVVLATYVLPLLPEARPNDRVLIWIKIGVFFSPVLVFFWGFFSFEEQDYEKRMEENPEEEKKRREDLISFLYEDEDKD